MGIDEVYKDVMKLVTSASPIQGQIEKKLNVNRETINLETN